MTLPAAVQADVEARLSQYCDRRIPAEIRDEVRLSFRIEGTSVVLFEERPAFGHRSRWIELPVAKFRYFTRLKEWRLFWRDRHSRWHNYDEIAPSESFRELLLEVDADPTCIFWG